MDDHAIIIDGLVALLEQHPEINVKSTTSSGKFALAYLAQEPYDLLITDLSMPDMNGVELIQKAKSIVPHLKVIVLSMHDEPQIVKEVMSTGIDGYILKKYARQELFQAIDAISENRQYWSADVTRALVSANSVYLSSSNELTDREKDVLTLLCSEMTSKQIAEHLYISERTVETHRKNLLRKTNSTNTIGLLKYAIANQLI